MDGVGVGVGGVGGAGVWDVFFLDCTTKSETKHKKTSTQKTDRLEHQQEGSGRKDTVGRFGEKSSHARQELKSAAGEGRVMQ